MPRPTTKIWSVSVDTTEGNPIWESPALNKTSAMSIYNHGWLWPVEQGGNYMVSLLKKGNVVQSKTRNNGDKPRENTS